MTLPPDETALRRYLLGELPLEDLEAVAAYLEAHPELASALATFAATDTLITSLRRGAAEADSPEVTRLIEQFSQLPSTPTPSEASLLTASAPPAIGDWTMPPDNEFTERLAPSAAPDELGRLGGYRVLRELGRGGMGVVFEAEEVDLGRRVALKVMSPALAANSTAKRRFAQEAKTASAVEHDYIVPIYRIGEDRGLPFLAMPLLVGDTLDDRLRNRKPLPIPDVLLIGRQIADGLAAAHAAGLIHRDIKPSNIWLERSANGEFRRVKILDFGLARLATGSGEPITHTGAIMGTPAYMAPEQARGMAVDSRADLFSLGSVLYHMATGLRPFTGDDTFAILTALATETPAAPSTVNPAVPPPLSELIANLLTKDANARRPATAQDVSAELGRIAAPPVLPSAVAEPALPPRPAAQRRMRRWGWLIAASLLFGALALAAANGPTIIRIANNEGELVVEVDDPNVEVTVKGTTVEILDPNGKRFLVSAGKDGEIEIREKGTDTVLVVEKFRVRRGDKVVVSVTNDRIAAARQPKPIPPAAAKPVSVSPHTPKYTNTVGMELVLIPKGRSWLGGGGGQPGNREYLSAVDYYLGVYEVTQEEWEKVTGHRPSFFSRMGGGREAVKTLTEAELNRFPVETVSYEDIQHFLGLLNERDRKAGWTYRLPTDAEWEYACRGGPLRDRFDSGFDAYFREPTNELTPALANFGHENGLKRPCPVGRYPSNPLGLHDMIGNVWELCEEVVPVEKGEPGRRLRGGFFGDPQKFCRAAGLGWAMPKHRANAIGFRVARVRSDDAPPAKDAFPGTLAFYDTFDDAKSCTLFQGSQDGTEYRVANGQYVMAVSTGKAGAGFVKDMPPCTADMAFAVRLRPVNAQALVAFRTRTSENRTTWLQYHTTSQGHHSLRRMEAVLRDGIWSHTSQTLFTVPGSLDANDKGITVVGRTIGASYQVWVNGVLLADATVEPDFEAPQVHPNGMRIGGVVATDNPSSIQVDSVAMWNLSPKLPAGASPPAKDAFPGRLLVYEACDDPHSCGFDLKAVGATLTEGVYRRDYAPGSVGKKWEAVGRPTRDLAAVLRVRATDVNWTAIFRERAGPRAASYLSFRAYTGGAWVLDRVTFLQDGDKFVPQPIKVLAKSTALCRELMSGRWVTLTIRTAGNEIEVWIDGISVVRVQDSGHSALTPTPSNGALSLAVDPQPEKAGRFEVDYVAAWDVAPESQLPAGDSLPDRKAAEYVLSIGGAVRVNDTDQDIKFLADLPAEPFALTTVWLRGNQQVTDAGLAAFAGCKRLHHLDLVGTPVTSAGMVHFKDCKELWVLDLVGTKVGDDGLAHFAGCKQLTSLWLGKTQVTNAGLATFKDCKALIHLDVCNTKVTDAGMAHFGGCPNLVVLGLPGTQLTDAGLAHFADCKKLKNIYLGETGITPDGLERVKRAFPYCRIEWGEGNVIEPRLSLDQPPAKDAFPGELLFHDTFDDPKACKLPSFTTGPNSAKAADGRYTISTTRGKADADLFQTCPPTASTSPTPANGVFALRLRVDGGTAWLNFRYHELADRNEWLSLRITAAGEWSLWRNGEPSANGKQEDLPGALVAMGERSDPELAAGKFGAVAAQWSDDNCDLWINGKRIFAGAVPNLFPGKVVRQHHGVRFGVRLTQDGPAGIELDYAAVWKLPDVPSR